MINKVGQVTNAKALNRSFTLLESEDTKNTTESTDKYNKETNLKEEDKAKKWLVIHYGGADNDLANNILFDVDELEYVGSDVNNHLVSVIDLGNYNNSFRGAGIFYVKQDNNYGLITSPIIKKLGQVNMADPVFMSNILKEIIKAFPAEHIAIFVGSHSGGWEGAIKDNGAGVKLMSIGHIREALESVAKEIGKKIDVLAFDSCYMAMAEVGYELKNAVKYMVASEARIESKGYNYTNLFSRIKNIQKTTNIDPRDFSKMVVNAAKEYSEDVKTISAVDLEKAKDLANAINSFAETVINKPNDIKKIREKRSQVQEFATYFRDLKDFMRLIVEDKTISEEVRNKAQEVIKKVDEYILAEFHVGKYPGANGVSIELPLEDNTPRVYYETLFAKDTKWDEMLNHLRYR